MKSLQLVGWLQERQYIHVLKKEEPPSLHKSENPYRTWVLVVIDDKRKSKE